MINKDIVLSPNMPSPLIPSRPLPEFKISPVLRTVDDHTIDHYVLQRWGNTVIEGTFTQCENHMKELIERERKIRAVVRSNTFEYDEHGNLIR